MGISAFRLFPLPTIGANNKPTSKQISLIAPVIAQQAQRPSSRYERPAVSDGLYYVAGDTDKCHECALVLSYNDRPIPSKANDPGAPTRPGFYLSEKDRYDFQRIEVIGEKVYFKTRSVRGISYEFVGNSGEEIIPDFDPSTPVPFIAGEITTLKNGKLVNKEKLKFSHAVIA
jgi:hypothetical protein